MESPQPKQSNFKGKLRLSPEARFGNWSSWTERVKKDVANGELGKAAHMLACCMVSPTTPLDELEQARGMFSLSVLVPYRQQLWDLIVADNESAGPWQEREKIANFLFDEFGWRIE